MPEAGGETTEVSERILKVIDCSLVELRMNALKLNFLPKSTGQLSRLHHLYLFQNQIESLPESFGQLSQLKWLNLANNQLESLPMSIAHCRECIVSLNLEANMNLKKLPTSFEFLYLLKEININKTNIDPEEVAALKVKWAAVNKIDAIQLLHIH